MTEIQRGIQVLRGDITTLQVDAIVTAANPQLVGGAGVNGAVHAAAGPELLEASRALAPCPPGQAVVTPAFALAPVKWVIHAVGPVYTGAEEDTDLLYDAYLNALRRADEVGARSVAIPSISTGIYGFPPGLAAPISVAACREAASSNIQSILLVAFSEDMEQLWREEVG